MWLKEGNTPVLGEEKYLQIFKKNTNVKANPQNKEDQEKENTCLKVRITSLCPLRMGMEEQNQ